VVERVSRSPYGALLGLDRPGPGIAALGTIEFDDVVMATFSVYLYANQRAATVAGETPLWEACFQEGFPTLTEPAGANESGKIVKPVPAKALVPTCAGAITPKLLGRPIETEEAREIRGSRYDPLSRSMGSNREISAAAYGRRGHAAVYSSPP
jgi:hypothetical protein